MEKPVIILGGGYLGTLLALRLKETRPEIPFVLFEESSALGHNRSEVFFDDDLSSWLLPFVTKSWSTYKIGNDNSSGVKGFWHYVDGGFFNQYAKSVIGNKLEFNKMPTPESALKRSAFVIDTRNNCYFSKTAFQADYSMEVVLENEHFLKYPLINNLLAPSSKSQRSISFYPLGPRRLFITESWVSGFVEEKMNDRRESLVSHLYERGWRIARVLKEEEQIQVLPFSCGMIRNEGRVIGLAGLFHGPGRSSIPQMACLVEKMTSGSFRFGELQKVVRECRQDLEQKGSAYLSVNKLVEAGRFFAFNHWLERQQSDFIWRYFSMNLSLMDRFRMKLWMMSREWKIQFLARRESESDLRMSEIN
jgi:lycopene beta-cyclase